MEKSDKDNELQSRRDFFRNSVKRVLPIVGALVMTNPIVASVIKMQESKQANYCTLGTCFGECVMNCLHGCDVTCS